MPPIDIDEIYPFEHEAAQDLCGVCLEPTDGLFGDYCSERCKNTAKAAADQAAKAIYG